MSYRIPNLFVIGAAKSGTSSLCSYISQHPDIYLPPIKEPHFFSFKEKQMYSNGPNDIKRMRGATGDLESYLKLFIKAEENKFICDGSTTYLDSIEAPYAIKNFSPNSKIVIILRNPVDRAFASFLHLRREGSEKFLHFEEALKEEQKRINKKWSIIWHYTQRQFVYEKIKRYYSIFNRSDIKIYEYEDWKKNNIETLRNLFSFLKINETISIDVSKKYNIGGTPKIESFHKFISNENLFKNQVKYIVPNRFRKTLKYYFQKINLRKPIIPKEIRQNLIRLYIDDIKKLQDLVNLDLSHWLSNGDI